MESNILNLIIICLLWIALLRYVLAEREYQKHIKKFFKASDRIVQQLYKENAELRAKVIKNYEEEGNEN